MDRKALYENLARHLNQGIVGAPMSPSLMGILEIMFSEEEAEIARKLPFENKTLEELKNLFPDKAGNLESILTAMAKNGTVFTRQKPGKERTYRLLPTVVGFAEAPYWAGMDTEKARKLAPLWIKYRDEGFGKELARNIPTVRVIPIDHSLRKKSEILPFDQLKEKIASLSYYSVSKCPCRQMMAYEGKGCGHSIDNCLHFGDMGRYVVEQGMGREISREEAVQILEDADKEGLVHAVENLDGYMSMICNCCPCCCVFLQTQNAATRLRMLKVARVMLDRYGLKKLALPECVIEATAPGWAAIRARKEITGRHCPVCGADIYEWPGRVRIINIQEGFRRDTVSYGCSCGNIFLKKEAIS